ncbi:asparaginase [Erythrobacter sp. YT30]|uniref:asparaginase n=1 Tax=Erythrobacter sp. YT30 TaxID=1735012 RepID=UPI00076C755E|nr:asparaginase [Erythrobacter sp. YT30]KWV90638.1 L-asparaginase [Erythrobacter sp. YT30]
MKAPHLLVLATGGTIAGIAGSPTRHDYRPGQIGIEDWLEQVRGFGLAAELSGKQIANIGSEDMGVPIWAALHGEIEKAMADPAIDGIVITHGTDTAEETAFLLDLTLPPKKPVVLVGAMRPADAVGSDGMRNFVNAVRVASDPDAAGRGVLLVMGDRILAARDARKVRTRGTDDAFRGFPRGSVGIVTPAALEWFGNPWREGEGARYAFPDALPDVPILYVGAGMPATSVARICGSDTKGVVIAGAGEGNMPEAVRQTLKERAGSGLVVVRASRVDEGLVDREPEDASNQFVAARALNPQKARILLQVLIANGESDLDHIQAAFDNP